MTTIEIAAAAAPISIIKIHITGFVEADLDEVAEPATGAEYE